MVSNASYSDAGYYSAIVRNSVAETSSSNVQIRVLPIAGWAGKGHECIPISGEFNECCRNFRKNNNCVLALRSDGSVVAWGIPAVTNNIPTMTNAIAVSAGIGQALALTADGREVAWGGTEANRDIPASVTNIVAIAAGELEDLALRADGQVIEWVRLPTDLAIPQPNMPPIIAIAASQLIQSLLTALLSCGYQL